LQVSPPVAYDQIVYRFGSFIVGGLFWPQKAAHHLQCSPCPLKICSPFLHSAIGRGVHPMLTPTPDLIRQHHCIVYTLLWLHNNHLIDHNTHDVTRKNTTSWRHNDIN
jgi:hypothetical protein